MPMLLDPSVFQGRHPRHCPFPSHSETDVLSLPDQKLGASQIVGCISWKDEQLGTDPGLPSLGCLARSLNPVPYSNGSCELVLNSEARDRNQYRRVLERSESDGNTYWDYSENVSSWSWPINPPASRYWRRDNYASSIYCLKDALQMCLAGYFFDQQRCQTFWPQSFVNTEVVNLRNIHHTDDDLSGCFANEMLHLTYFLRTFRVIGTPEMNATNFLVVTRRTPMCHSLWYPGGMRALVWAEDEEFDGDKIVFFSYHCKNSALYWNLKLAPSSST